MSDERESALERRSRELFDESVSTLDMRLRSRLNQSRQVALGAVVRPRASFLGLPLAASAAGVCAAALVGVALFIGMPGWHLPTAPGETSTSFEDLDIVAVTEESSGDTLEMLQEDADFYDWAADKGTNADANGA
jgi:hypothetical protein